MPLQTAFRILLGIFFGITVLMLILLVYQHQLKTKSTDEKILIKKVEIVPYTFMGSNAVSVKITLKKPIQCGEHTTTVLYNNFASSGYLSLLLPMVYPDRTYYLKNPEVFWDESDKKCTLGGVIIVQQVPDEKIEVGSGIFMDKRILTD